MDDLISYIALALILGATSGAFYLNWSSICAKDVRDLLRESATSDGAWNNKWVNIALFSGITLSLIRSLLH